jgi:CRISPR-associated protein (TIGR03986 family)
MLVKSPYNFVPAPAEDEVYTPEWASQVSHDIPFSDGESGEITLKITAQSPIFIRNGHSEGVEENEFSHVVMGNEKKYFIPATSLKGMLRNVLEIMSFSRMRQINNHKHSVRQIMKTVGTVIDEGYELSGKENENILAGYLIQRGAEYFIHSCGKPLKIRYSELDKYLNTRFAATFERSVSSNFDERTGAFKYEKIIEKRALEHKFEIHPLDGEKESSWKGQYQSLDYVRFAGGELESFWGRVVCVGQASPYSVKTGRKGEYVFKGKREEILNSEKNKVEVPREVLKAFLFVNKHNKKKTEELKDWTYWKDKLATGIPVFYRFDKKQNKVKDLGLTFMYKQPVLYSVMSLLPYKPGKDLSELIFGSIIDNNAQKGRVFMSHFWAKGAKQLSECTHVLASPKSSFTPFYLTQNGSNGETLKFNTYNTASKLRGFKRYPVHSSTKSQSLDFTNSDMTSRSRPLDKGAIFEGKIRFHNLRPMEIGALLSAITFHNTPETYHSLGGLKPFGYGRIKVEIDNLDKYNKYLKIYELKMKAHNGRLWVSRLNELIAMASVQQNEDSLQYLSLNEFQLIKNKGKYLQKYSDIVNWRNSVKFLCSDQEVSNEIEKQRVEKQMIEKKKIETKKEADVFYLNDEYNKAKITYSKYKLLDPQFDLTTTIENIASQEVLFLELQELYSNPTIESLVEYRSKYPNSKWDKQIENIIEEIRIRNKKNEAQKLSEEELAFPDNRFNTIKTVLNKFLKNKQFVFSNNQLEKIKLTLKESYNLEKGDRKSDWNKNPYPKYPWSDISKWLGDEQAKSLHSELNK